MEIKNKLTEGRGRGMVGENREGLSRNMYKGPLDKAKGAGGREMAEVGGSGRGEMETSVLEQQ